MKEHWRLIPGFDHLAISDHGRVISLGRTVPDKRYGLRKIRSKLMSVSKTGTFGTGTGGGTLALLYLPTVYREVWGRELTTKPWPMRGRYLE